MAKRNSGKELTSVNDELKVTGIDDTELEVAPDRQEQRLEPEQTETENGHC